VLIDAAMKLGGRPCKVPLAVARIKSLAARLDAKPTKDCTRLILYAVIERSAARLTQILACGAKPPQLLRGLAGRHAHLCESLEERNGLRVADRLQVSRVHAA
jgi:hypothetical protein